MQLGKTDLRKAGVISLRGEWEFYWKKLPDFTTTFPAMYKPDGFITLPGNWNTFKIGKTAVGSKGFATYRLRLKTDLGLENAAVKIYVMDHAYSLFLNGVKIASRGKVAEDESVAVPEWYPAISLFSLPAGENELVLQVSNFWHRSGGAYSPILLGSSENILNFREKNLIREMLVFGAILFMSIYHLFLFINRRTEKAYLYLSIFSLLIAFRIVLTEERVLLDYLRAAAPTRRGLKAGLLAAACAVACLAVPIAIGGAAAVSGAVAGEWWLLVGLGVAAAGQDHLADPAVEVGLHAAAALRAEVEDVHLAFGAVAGHRRMAELGLAHAVRAQAGPGRGRRERHACQGHGAVGGGGGVGGGSVAVASLIRGVVVGVGGGGLGTGGPVRRGDVLLVGLPAAAGQPRDQQGQDQQQSGGLALVFGVHGPQDNGFAPISPPGSWTDPGSGV